MRVAAFLALGFSIPALAIFVGCDDSGAPGPTAQAGQGSVTDNSGKTNSGADATTTAVSNQPPAGKPGRGKPAPAGPRDITFDDLKFDIEPDAQFERSMLTPEIEALDGTRVRLRGYINPYGVFTQTGITQFIFVRDNMQCCFGPGAALYDCTVVEMQPGKATDYNIYPITVEGIFTINELVDPDGVVRAVFHLEGESIE